MTEYWKSLPRKFCIYCKCWITDNKSSVEFHERGKNHQENVKKKLDELRKKGLKDAKEKEGADSVLKAIEEAALKSAKEDIKRDPSLASLYGAAAVARASEVAPAAAVAPASAARAKAPFAAPKGGKRQASTHVSDSVVRSSKSNPVDRQGVAAVTLELIESREAGCIDSTDDAQAEDAHADDVQADDAQADDAQADDAQADDTKGEWQKALSPEGYEYYWNVRTGESSWTLPGDEATESAVVPVSAETTAAVEPETCSTRAHVASDSVTESVTDAASAQPPVNDASSMSSVTLTLPVADRDPPSILKNISDQGVCIKAESVQSDSQNVSIKDVCVKPEPGSQDSTCDTLRTFKTEIMAADTVKAESDHAVSSARAAIAAASARLKAAASVKLEGGIKAEAPHQETSNIAATHVKVERTSEVEEGTTGDSNLSKGGAEVGRREKVTIQKRPPAAIKFSPYGSWVAVEQENSPTVDLELPTDATKYSVSAADIPLPEPVPVKDTPLQFKEKVVTLQGRHAGGGEVAFKKRKIGGARNNSRRRDDEDE